jgi:hypothetical protein
MAAANSQLTLVHRADHVTGSTSAFDTVLEPQRATRLRAEKELENNAARDNGSRKQPADAGT